MKTKLPIATKFIGGFVLILLGISLFLFFYFPPKIKKTLLAKETTNAEVLIDVVSVGASLALAEGDFEVLSLTINIAKEFPNAQYIIFLDEEEEQVAMYNPKNLSIDSSYVNMDLGKVVFKDKMIVRSPLLYENKLYGSLVLNYSFKETNKIIAGYQNRILLVSLLILIIGAVVAIYLSKGATEPINKLMLASKKVTQGDLSAMVDINTNDEFELLGETFNYMLQSIRENKHVQLINDELRNNQQLLEQKNVELEEQSDRMKEQQAELEVVNEALLSQKEKVALKNEQLQKTSSNLFEKAKQLELSNKYKSEFLANMSHELRSPLNSMLILANDLVENEHKNLTEDQVESAKIIYNGGKELLNLINDILDLSKIESGRMEVVAEDVNLNDLAEQAVSKYQHMATQKKIEFLVKVENNLPQKVTSDEQRLTQIINNLLSNAIKFTEKGKVALTFQKSDDDYFSIKVKDTGIGIPENKLELIFKAFTQADGGTTRKYGGTGLGLAITNKLSKLLGGEINVSSTEGFGSEFTVKLPIKMQSQEKSKEETTEKSIELSGNDTSVRLPELNKELILVIEDDEKFVQLLKKEINKFGYKVLSTSFGEEGLELAKSQLPFAIILDLGLPDISGKEVLKKLKENSTLKHIPVHVMSSSTADQVKQFNVVQFVAKPIDKSKLKEAFQKILEVKQETKTLLVVEDHQMTRNTLKKLFSKKGIEVIPAASLKEAQSIVENNTPMDGIILDLKLPDGNGKELLQSLQNRFKENVPSIIVYTGTEMDKDEITEINNWAKKLIKKGEHSQNKLIEEVLLFLNYAGKDEGDEEFLVQNKQYDIFKGKTVLLVDDDMRNVFALSKMLVSKGIQVIKAANGIKALEELKKDNQIDMVLMDIMMPEMDGYEAMREIRKMPVYKDLPILALTAKAMKEDKEKCIQAGANDYMSKPIDMDKLFNLMRVWMTKIPV